MWKVRKINAPPSLVKLVVFHEGNVAAHGAVIEGLVQSSELRTALIEALAGLPFEAFYWEMPPLTNARMADDFDSAALDAPELLTRTADATAFEEHLNRAREGAASVTFTNLGGDATLVAPTAEADAVVYGHLATFVREAPRAQVDALFEAVGQAVLARVGDEPLWVSTAGLGVPWLHVRLDARPKYYKFDGYRDAASPRWPVEH